MSSFDEDEILSEFIQECKEHLDTIENDLLLVENPDTPDREDLLNKIFRAAHSIKGGAGFLGFSVIQELAHKTENVLDRVRGGDIEPSPEVINVLLQAFDRLTDLIHHYSGSNQEDVSELCLALTGLLSSFLPEAEKARLNQSVEVEDTTGSWRIEVNEYDLANANRQGQFVYLVRIDLIHDIEAKGLRPYDLIREISSAGSILASRINLASVGSLDDEPSNFLPLEILYGTIVDPDFVDGLFEGVPAENIHLVSSPDNPEVQQPPDPHSATSDERDNAPPMEEEFSPEPNELQTVDEIAKPEETASSGRLTRRPRNPVQEKAAPKVDETLRVSVSLLEKLMNLAGELVLARNQLLEANRLRDSQLTEASTSRIDLVSSELQEAIMQTRMQPVGNVISKLPRLIRDLSQKSGKQIQLEISGAEVEMDKAIVEGIGDPLTHMIRNSADHGIESPDTRRAAGKPAQGCVSFSARHEAGQVVIEIADDGKGMDPEAIAESAVGKGKISQETADRLSNREKLNLIFLPGLSTAKTVTDVSGRGVGMDVVKTNIDRLGGQIDIESEVGVGSLFRITLPLTLAIMPALLVTAGNNLFAIPQPNVRELIRIGKDEVADRVRQIGSHRTITVRDQLMPIIYLSDLVKREPSGLPRDKNLNILVVRAGNLTYGLCVDALHDTEEIVVRPLGCHLQSCKEFAGATILGNGKVAMILDAGGIAERANFAAIDGDQKKLAEETKALSTAKEGSDSMQLLLFYNSPTEPCALPLHAVRRIERIEASQIDELGGVRSMHYREASLPLVTMADLTQMNPVDYSESLIVVVLHPQGSQPFGLLGIEPVDVEAFTGKIDARHQQKGILGSCRIEDRTTLLVDMNALNPHSTLENSPMALTQAPALQTEELPAAHGATIVLAEDSDFFRNQLVSLLESNHFTVRAHADGQLALDDLTECYPEVDLVLTDIEMPNMNGLEFTRAIRANPHLQHLPIVAITTLADDEDVERGKSVGVTEYQIKLDKEMLLQSIQKILNLTPSIGSL